MQITGSMTGQPLTENPRAERECLARLYLRAQAREGWIRAEVELAQWCYAAVQACTERCCHKP